MRGTSSESRQVETKSRAEMNQALFCFSLGSFMALPNILHSRPGLMPWWALFLLLSGGGWLLVNSTVYFNFEYLNDVIDAHPNPPEELYRRASSDGAKRVFALFFGWLYGPVYSVPFFVARGWYVPAHSLTDAEPENG